MSPSRRLPLLAVVLSAACGGSPPAPPPPSPSPPGALRPLSSREAPAGPAVNALPRPAPQPSLPPGHPPVEGAASAAAPRVSGTVTIAPELQTRAGANDVLYVIAKKAGATLAVRREDKVRFPFAFELTEADLMVQGTAFTGPVDLVARLSKTGDALPAPGDLEGDVGHVALGATGVTITLDTVRR